MNPSFNINHIKENKLLANNPIFVDKENSNTYDLKDKWEEMNKHFGVNQIETHHDIISSKNKGQILLQQKKYDEALDFYLCEIQKQPNNEEHYNKIRICLDEIKREKDPVECYNNYIDLEFDLTSAYTKKGICLRLLNKHQEAVHCFDEAIKLDNKSISAIFNKKLAQEELNKQNVDDTKNNAEDIVDSKIKIDLPDSKLDENFKKQINNFTLKYEDIKILISNKEDISKDPQIKSEFQKIEVELNELININATINPSAVNSDNDKSEFNLIKSSNHEFAKKRISIEECFGKLLELINKNQEINNVRYDELKNDVDQIKLQVYELQQELEFRLKDHKKSILSNFKKANVVDYDKVNDYIYGFSITLSNQFVCSQIIKTEKVQINYNTLPISVFSAVASLIPGFGLIIGGVVKTINHIINDVKFKQETNKILKLANDAIDFSNITGKLLGKILENKSLKKNILTIKEEAIKLEFDSIFSKIKEYFKEKLEKLDKYIYGDIYDKFHKKLGFIHADLIIKEILKGNITNNNFIDKSIDTILQFTKNVNNKKGEKKKNIKDDKGSNKNESKICLIY